MKKYFRFGCLTVIGIVFLGTFAFLYQKSRPKEVKYEIVSPEKKTIKKTTVITGSVEPRDEVLIKSQISGIISDIYKEAGQEVKKGEIIAKVKVIPELGQLNSAESRLRLAEISSRQAETDFARTKKLYKDKLVSSEEYDKELMTYKRAKEELQTAKDALQIIKEGITKSSQSFSSTLIRSTIDGLILDIPIKKGNSVIMSNTFNDGTTIASVANMNDLIFKGKVDETEVGKLHEGMKMKLTIGALEGVELNANVEYISPKGTVNNGSTQYEVKAAIELPAGTFIRSGYSANGEVILSEVKDALSLPEKCIEFEGDSTFVYIVTSENPQQFEKKAVKTGISDGVNINIKKGVTMKQKVRGNIINE